MKKRFTLIKQPGKKNTALGSRIQMSTFFFWTWHMGNKSLLRRQVKTISKVFGWGDGMPQWSEIFFEFAFSMWCFEDEGQVGVDFCTKIIHRKRFHLVIKNSLKLQLIKSLFNLIHQSKSFCNFVFKEISVLNNVSC